MQTKDAIYWIGLMAGLVIGSQIMKMLGIGGILQFLGGLVLGVGCGLLAERLYVRSKTS